MERKTEMTRRLSGMPKRFMMTCPRVRVRVRFDLSKAGLNVKTCLDALGRCGVWAVVAREVC